ncbi:MAG: hypothetical protein ACRAVC_15935 [Trichormus sp.]
MSNSQPPQETDNHNPLIIATVLGGLGTLGAALVIAPEPTQLTTVFGITIIALVALTKK